jgi:hypothetical protein
MRSDLLFLQHFILSQIHNMALLQKSYLGSTPLFRNEDWFEKGAYKIINYGGIVTVTANSAAHTKGVWAQLISSTSADASLLNLNIAGLATNALNTASLLDIGTGASSSETVIASNIAIGAAGGTLIEFPYKIPSGTRIAARMQSVVTGFETCTVRAVAIDAGDYATAPTSIDVTGSNVATSSGINFAGASNTWVEGISSTTRPYRAVGLVLSAHNNALANVTNGAFQVGTGAAGQEVNIGETRYNYSASEVGTTVQPYSVLFGHNIPSGSRISVRHTITANPQFYGFNLIGIP